MESATGSGAEVRLLTTADLDQAFALDQQAFNTPDAARPDWERVNDPARTHGVFENGRLVAMSLALPLGQYFGGRRVAMGGLSSVAVSPECRGSGHGSRVVTASLRGMRERGEAISSLYPGTTNLYRGLGWELAGALVLWQLPPRSLLALARPDAGHVGRAQPSELSEMKQLYARLAPQMNGHLDRSEWGWGKLERHWDDYYVYLARDADDQLEGYLVYKHGASPAGGGDFPIRVVEVVAASREASSGLWWLVGSSASQVDQITYQSSPEDPLALLLPEQHARTAAAIRWMLRVVDVESAVGQRGYSPALELAVPITLVDEHLPENSGDWVLRVSKGEGSLEPGSGSGVRMGIGAFSSLYSGWSSTSRLSLAGLLEGGSEDDRAKLDGAFAGPTPWMLEEF